MNGLVEKYDSCVMFGLSGLRLCFVPTLPLNRTVPDRSIILSLIRSYLAAVSQ